MENLTKIEQLDLRVPGLADKVRVWFDQGVPVRKVSELLFEQHNISVPRATVGNFRARRWVRDRELSRQKRLAALAAQEVLRELAMQDSPAASTASIQAKIHSAFLLDKSSCLGPITDPSIQFSKRFREK